VLGRFPTTFPRRLGCPGCGTVAVGANARLKVPPIVAGMIAGADSIDDLDVLRHGGMTELFGGVRALSLCRTASGPLSPIARTSEGLAIIRICAARSPMEQCIIGVWLERRSAMHATVGDRVHIKGRNVGMQEHVGEILEVRGPEGEPPYLVRYVDGHESLVYPGPDCIIEQRGPAD
jgi:uncharacterized protein DUF1918